MPCNCKKISESIQFTDPIMVQFPVLIKSSIGSKGKRIIEFEASCEEEDQEGDIILQQALLGGKDSFLENGVIDIDHYSEIGKNPEFAWLGIKNPDSYIIGTPINVIDLGNGRTGVKAEIYKSNNGIIDIKNNKFDKFWEELQNVPPTKFYASVYGFPGADTLKRGCAVGADGVEHCATRYLVKSFYWKSTAVTKKPINDSLKKAVKIVTMKSFAAKFGMILTDKTLIKDNIGFNRDILFKSYYMHMNISCPFTDSGNLISVNSMRKHFMVCENQPYSTADLYALATIGLLNK